MGPINKSAFITASRNAFHLGDYGAKPEDFVSKFPESHEHPVVNDQLQWTKEWICSRKPDQLGYFLQYLTGYAFFHFGEFTIDASDGFARLSVDYRTRTISFSPDPISKEAFFEHLDVISNSDNSGFRYIS